MIYGSEVNLELKFLKNGKLAWIDGSGPNSDVVISSRIRIARNLAKHQFSLNISSSEEDQVSKEIKKAVSQSVFLSGSASVYLADLTTRDRQLLLEKHLVSPDLIKRSSNALVIIDKTSSLSLMINEEDHIRLQCIMSGSQLERCWDTAGKFEREISGKLDFAYHPKFGYLTSCPTNTGTGLRASVLVHLPGLVLTKEIGKVLRGISQIGLTFRGLYGEGSDVVGNYFQISNQTTLGKSEEELIDHLDVIIKKVCECEANARQVLLRDAREQVEDKVWRAFGLLKYTRSISTEELMNLLSAVRLGSSMKLIAGISVSTLNKLMIYTQVAHIETIENRSLKPQDRDVLRANLVRNIFEKEVFEQV